MKIKWSSLFFGSFAHHFQIKLSILGSNFNSRFVSISELELFLLTRVLTPNFNSVNNELGNHALAGTNMHLSSLDWN
jgi:hypothetical protein